MIISASYKTDIPRFYGEWFANRLDAGYCMMVNPYNTKQVIKISLKREDVDGFVFWTKDLGPFMDKLNVIHQKGYPFTVQYTIHDYPRELETFVTKRKKSVNYMKMIAERFGPHVAVWRYDPIILTSLTSFDFHLNNFETLAQELEGTTNEVVISFAQIYKKTLINLNKASELTGFKWEDPADEKKIEIASLMAEIAHSHEMQLTMCSQKQFLAQGVKEARCIDARRLSKMGGSPIRAKLNGNRRDCGCYESKDIGDYDTCPHGCVYCYAVRSIKLAKERFRQHDPNGEFLYTHKENNNTKFEIDKGVNKSRQTKLF
ncbi:DUF1848 domain-containing protein [Methanothrix soehngenii]|jgi:hypothetical protein|uniref:DUF1848 domain-containing protein n=1 Tax=Methanothrix soehngenii TaxID=2223 RepID=UPI002FDFAF59